jgi:hypothetical protein
MANYITIDGGTTNTRVNVVCDKTTVATKKLGIGSGSKDTEALKNAIQAAIAALLSENHLLEADIECILASGMITSEYGLCDLPHVSLPANTEKLHNAMHKTVIEDVSSIPFVFIRGVKKEGTDLDGVDVMRGEETELVGMLKTDMPMTDISSLVKLQLEQMPEWEVLSFAVSGKTGSDKNYSMPGLKASVMYQDEALVGQASSLLTRFLNGEVLTEADLEIS